MQFDRRRLLQGLGATGIGLALLPFLGRARAAPGPVARARRVLILNLAGGIRSSAAFHASAQVACNPYGLISTATPFALGRLLDDASPDSAYQLPASWGGARLPRLREIADQFSVVGTYSMQRGDHLRARIEEPTGSASGQDPGILTRIAAGLDAAGLEPSAPSFHLTPTALFGNGVGALSKFAPVSLAGHMSLPNAASVDQTALQRTGNNFATDEMMRDRLDQHHLATRAGPAKLITSTFDLHRIGARVIGARLAQPDMAVALAEHRQQTFGTVMLDGQTVPLGNGMLSDLFLQCLGTDEDPYRRDSALNAALVIRLLQLGSPAVSLDVGGFDFHSGERTGAPPLYAYLGRLWAALRWLLPRIPDPSGEGSLFDRTLVVTMSDFGRDRAAGGWNGGEGSDHGADHACFYLAHAVMGAGVKPNKLVGPVDTTTYDARASAIRYDHRQLLATILDALGLDPFAEEWGLPAAGTSIGELWS